MLVVIIIIKITGVITEELIKDNVAGNNAYS